ncbi:MAG: hypothetical protein AABW50_02925 [Nanoarchaeota archaeon]
MIKTLFDKELDAELIATFIFILISGFYILTEYGTERLIDALFLWMFPASIMIFLTLLIVKIIERYHERRVKRYRYVDWRK